MKKKQVKTVIKDHEGVDFEPQLLSHRKLKTTLEMYHDSQGHEKMDIRKYFPKNQIRELNFTQTDTQAQEYRDVEFVDDDRGDQRGGYKSKRRGGYNSGYSRRDRDEPQSIYVPKNLTNDEFCLEDCNMVSYLYLDITKDELYDALMKILKDTDVFALRKKGTDYYKEVNDVTEEKLFQCWVDILGKRVAFKVFPFFIATCERQDVAKNLDDYFYEQILKLPRRNKIFLLEAKTFADLFTRLHQEVENNIVTRIKDGKIKYQEKHYIMDPSRIFQLIQIIKRLGNNDLSSFKFAMNFGLTPKTRDLVINEILLKDPSNAQAILNDVNEHEIFILMKYLETCKNKELKRLNHEINKISKNLLEETFRKHPEISDIFAKHFSKDEFKELKKTSYIDRKESVDLEELEKRGDLGSKAQQEERKVEVPDAKDKFMFPDLDKIKSNDDPITPNNIIPLPVKSKKKKLEEEYNTKGWNKSSNPYGYQAKALDGSNMSNLKKKMEEDFPTLAGDSKKSGGIFDIIKPSGTKKASNIAGGWEKPPAESEQYYEDDGYYEGDDAVEIVTQKKGKKAKSKVFLSGGFK